MYLRINGVDFTRSILQGGLSLSENDLDSPKAGRTLDAWMHRGKVAEKKRADIKLWPLSKAELDLMLPILKNEYVNVETDIFAGNAISASMYCSTRKYNVAIVDTSGKTWYSDVAFNIIQR